MRQFPESEDQALANRLTSYSDAMVAVAFIFSSGLGLAIADPDTRDTIADATGALIIFNAVLGVLFSVLLVIIRRWELDLRADSGISEKFQRYSHIISISRHLVIWVSVTLTFVLMFKVGI